MSEGQTLPEPRLLVRYRAEIKPALKKKFALVNDLQVAKLTKIVLNMSLSEAITDRKAVENARQEMAMIAGQMPAITRARKSLANFKLREGMALGCRVTLRGRRMYEFADRLVTIALPRSRDFRGLNTRSFDGSGNYSLGIKEHIIFPEVDYDKVTSMRGMDIIICTSTRDDRQARALLEMMNFPFPGARGARMKAAAGGAAA